MPTNISTINIKASKERVWEVLTNAGLVKQWQYGSDLATTWEVGTPIRFRTEWDGKIFEQWGRVLEVRPPYVLRYSLFAPRPGLEDKPEHYFTMSYVLTEEGDHIKLQIEQEDNRPGARQEPPQGEENPILQSLQKLAEAE